MSNLIKIQSELKAPKNQTNAFGKYKYRSCEDILEAVKPLLAKYNCQLVISDAIKEAAGVIYCESRIVFTDGLENLTVTACAGIEPNRKGMDIAQSFGASSSYARKYALNGLFLIDDTKDADATNDHNKVKEESKPFMTDEKMLNLMARYNDGEKDIFEKAKIHLILRDKDLLTIKALK
ncbi:Essential recombination function protein [uncultured Caudovirales phage]|uniref:Essential recombination function protein n=1 Tax=uncultured Caudovirales phage TaxID=2100421 RepID=A0A6J5S6N4_9CAUD|nr:Essential recombination function protein [uncultured Caudovirales phage]